jgi:hypothetical protein
VPKSDVEVRTGITNLNLVVSLLAWTKVRAARLECATGILPGSLCAQTKMPAARLECDIGILVLNSDVESCTWNALPEFILVRACQAECVDENKWMRTLDS